MMRTITTYTKKGRPLIMRYKTSSYFIDFEVDWSFQRGPARFWRTANTIATISGTRDVLLVFMMSLRSGPVTELKNAHISSRHQFSAFRRRRFESDDCAQERSKEGVSRVSKSKHTGRIACVLGQVFE